MKDENGDDFYSAEHPLAHKCAVFHDDQDATRRLDAVKGRDPYEYMHIMRDIKKSQPWKDLEIEKLEEIVNEKFVQHMELLRRLCARQDHIFEATLHPTYGIQALLKDHLSISWDKNTSKNNWMGKILERVRARHT